MPRHRCAPLVGTSDIRSALSGPFSENYRNIILSKYVSVFLSKMSNRADLREEHWFYTPSEALNVLNTASAPKMIGSRRLHLQNHDLEFQRYNINTVFCVLIEKAHFRHFARSGTPPTALRRVAAPHGRP